MLNQISQLYRALVWEGFILLAVAAGEDSGNGGGGSSSEEEKTDSSSMEQQTTTNTEPESAPATADQSACNSSSSADMELGETMPSPNSIGASPELAVAMETNGGRDTTGSSLPSEMNGDGGGGADPDVVVPSGSYSDQLSKHPSILVESLKQLTPLLTITSRVGRSLAELMSLLIRLSTSPLHRVHRRGPSHTLIVHSYQEPAKEAIDVCMEVTNLLVDSLRWEVPMPQACSSAMQSPIRDWLFAG